MFIAFGLLLRGSRNDGALQPAQFRGLPALEGCDVGVVAERERDLVESLEQALLAERIDLEPVHGSGGRDHFLALEIDAQMRARLPRELGFGEVACCERRSGWTASRETPLSGRR